ncbi:sulfotransferase domain-containing protein [Patescibacteria group bacterium]|nr:sulfotransferase domain-containing protein [Patescibacteria group bacterium]
MRKQKPALIYFGHHKCASTWIYLIIKSICNELYLNYKIVDFPLSEKYTLDDFLLDSPVDFIVYRNANYKYITLKNYKGFHVIRDPRDICISGFFSHLYSHPVPDSPWGKKLKKHRDYLNSVSKAEGLLAEIKFSHGSFNKMYEWHYNNDNIYECKMEVLTKNSYEEFLKIFSFLGILNAEKKAKDELGHYIVRNMPSIIKKNSYTTKFLPTYTLSNSRALKIVYDNRFSALSGGRNKGKEDKKSHYRKGVSGDWKNHFEQVHKDYFKDHYNDILIKLGYEKDANW